MTTKIIDQPFCIFLSLLLSIVALHEAVAATPGLPFTEDFSADNLIDKTKTTAALSTEEQSLRLAFARTLFGALVDPPVFDISSDQDNTRFLTIGDINGDSHPDIIAGNGRVNKFYLNTGLKEAPFAGVVGNDLPAGSIVLGDVDGDGDLDLVGDRLYVKNNGTNDPFVNVSGTTFGEDGDPRGAIALGDFNGDGDLDVVSGNRRLYLNNGTNDPFVNVSGLTIGEDDNPRGSITLGDFNGDGDLDVVFGYERLYLNNGTDNPFANVNGTSFIDDDMSLFSSIALGDMDGDGDLDVVIGNSAFDRAFNFVYLNNGTANPFADVEGLKISNDDNPTRSIAVGDVDGDGDLDVIAGNSPIRFDTNDGTNRLYLNNGTTSPFADVEGLTIDIEVNNTSIVLEDADSDGDLDLFAANFDAANVLYLNQGSPDPPDNVDPNDPAEDKFQTHVGAVVSLTIDNETEIIHSATLTATVDIPPNTNIDFFLSNNGGQKWHQVKSDEPFAFPTMGSDLRWRAELHSLSPEISPVLTMIQINGNSVTPEEPEVPANISASALSASTISLEWEDNSTNETRFQIERQSGDGLFSEIVTVDANITSYTDRGLQAQTGYSYRVRAGNAAGNSDYSNTATATTEADNGGLPRLPLTEDFSSDSLIDTMKTTAGISTEEQAVRLAFTNRRYNSLVDAPAFDISSDRDQSNFIAIGDVNGDGNLDLVAANNGVNKYYRNTGLKDAPFADAVGVAITADEDSTSSIALGDVDRDGDLDVVAGNLNSPNRLYLNNGTVDPFGGVNGIIISGDENSTVSIALGDMNGDGSLDIVAVNKGLDEDLIRLHLNNGTENPFDDVDGTLATGSIDVRFIALGDMDGDGDLDVVVGNSEMISNSIYLNDGTANPFDNASELSITEDADDTSSIAIGDMDGDGDLDVVAGNIRSANRLYLNNGTKDPFSNVKGLNISDDNDDTFSIALGDIDSDGNLDVVAKNRLYLNNGTENPFANVDGQDITDDPVSHIALGDVDLDGDLDVVAKKLDNTNTLYLNNSIANPFANVSRVTMTSDFDNTNSIAIGDMDGDGDLDVVTGNGESANRLYLNNGSANPFANVNGLNITDDADDTRSIAVGDMDGNGDLDVVVGNGGFNEPTRLYLNNGSSNPFEDVNGVAITEDVHNSESIALGDMDGDGDLDVVVGKGGDPNRLYLNNGTENPFSNVNGLNISDDADLTESIALGDVDDDGDLDVVAGNDFRTNRLYLNNGTANPFESVSGLIISDEDDIRTQSIALGDMDSDGDLDLVVGNEDLPNRLYLNNGTENPFANVSGLNFSGDPDITRSVALGDVNGDGDLDVIFGHSDFDIEGEPNRVFLNNGTANPFENVNGLNITDDEGETYSIGLSDMDGDGDLDVVAGNVSGLNRLYLYNGPGNPFAHANGEAISEDEEVTNSIALGDVDGDGDQDIVVGNREQPNRLYLNDGTDSPFTNVNGANISEDDEVTFSIALGDINGDGDLDVVTGNVGVNRYYLNNGTEFPFENVTGLNISDDDDVTLALALGDVDGDGDLDVLAGTPGSQPSRLYLNNGSENPFENVIGLNISDDDVDITLALALGDVDGDGNLDLVTGNAGVNRVYLNNATGNPFENVTGTNISEDTDRTESLALDDVDGDGDLDVVAGNSDGPNRLYLNNGTENPFENVTGLTITDDADNTSSIALKDIDGDGDLDVVAGNAHGNRVYRNNGSEEPFAKAIGATIAPFPDNTQAIAVADVNGDSLPELITGNSEGPNYVYFLHSNLLKPAGGELQTHLGTVVSLSLDDRPEANQSAILTAVAEIPLHSSIEFYLSNNGGQQWYQVQSGEPFIFPTVGQDLRWRAELQSLSPAVTPVLTSVSVTANPVTPEAPEAPSNLSATVLSSSSISLEWEDNSDNETHFRVDRMTADGSFQEIAAIDTNITSHTDEGLQAETEYSYRVRAENAAGNSDFSNIVMAMREAENSTKPGLPFTENFSSNGLIDKTKTTTDINTEEQSVRLAFAQKLFGALEDPPVVDISSDQDTTFALAIGDINGDGHSDLIAGNSGVNKFYLNTGLRDAPFAGVVGNKISDDDFGTSSIVIGDVDGDGDLDVVAGTRSGVNRLYLNNGTTDPFANVTGTNITDDNHNTRSIALGDVDSDGDLDVVAGNSNFQGESHNRLYLNNGTADPFANVTGLNITDDDEDTSSIALGDMDGDGDLDVVAAHPFYGTNRLYLNNGTVNPFAGVTGLNISNDLAETNSIALGDMDGDGDLDVVIGVDDSIKFGSKNRLYLNNGTADPFAGVTGISISDGSDLTVSIALGDVNNDGHLDVISGNVPREDTSGTAQNQLFLNNGTANPFSDVEGLIITNDTDDTDFVALGNVDGDSDLDVIFANSRAANRLYVNTGSINPPDNVDPNDPAEDKFQTHAGAVVSLTIDDETEIIHSATLTATADLPPNTSIDFFLSNNGGHKWHQVKSDEPFAFPTMGSDLRWRAELHSLSPGISPVLTKIQINGNSVSPEVPEAPANISASALSASTISLEWEDNSTNETRFQIERKSDDGSFSEIVTVDANITNYTDRGLQAETEYSYRVRAGNAAGNSEYSNTATATTEADNGGLPRLPLTEDFSSDSLIDTMRTTAGFSTEEQAIRLAFTNRRYGALVDAPEFDISGDQDQTNSIAVGDINGDGHLDLVAANNGVNKYYRNTGLMDAPFADAIGIAITADEDSTSSIALGDVDLDGDLDIVAGNLNSPNRLYLNNGTVDPFGGVKGIIISGDENSTASIALGDMNGDGSLDFVSVNKGLNEDLIRLHLNNGTGNPFDDVDGTLATGSIDVSFIALGDMDGDGNLDVVVGNSEMTSNSIYLNDGTANPFDNASELSITEDADDTSSIAIGDMDGDGDLDVVAGNIQSANRLYLNNGTEDPFSNVKGLNISDDNDDTFFIAIGDIDSDGDLDVVAANSDRSRQYLNNGTVNPFANITGATIVEDGEAISAITLGDVDRDGDLDVVAGNRNLPNRLYLNTDNKNPFANLDGLDIANDNDPATSVALGDIDGDGDIDIVARVVLASSSLIRLYLNNGTANPFFNVTGANITEENENTSSIAVGDVDGDGDLDVVVGMSNSPNQFFLNNGTANPFSNVNGINITEDSDSTSLIAMGDMDGDGDLDVVVSNRRFDQPNRLYLNNGTADPFANVTGVNIVDDGFRTSAIALGDMDGDGDIDVVAGFLNGPNRLYLNNGSASPFADVSGLTITGDGFRSLALGDMNGDGNLDVVAAVFRGSQVYLNNGTENPFENVDGVDIEKDTIEVTSVALGDIDRDGDLDVVTGNSEFENNNIPNRLFLNNGTENPFEDVTGVNISEDEDDTAFIALGDMDGDGDLDVVAGPSNKLYLNNGPNNPFAHASGEAISEDEEVTNSIALGDVDGDGDQDIVVGNREQPNRLYLNDGTGSPFTNVNGANISEDDEVTFSIALGDINGDGDLDVVTGNVGVNRFYLNNGTGIPFENVTGLNISDDDDVTLALALGDVDGDGDLDLLAGTPGSQPSRLYLNNGSENPFEDVIGLNISDAEVDITLALALGDVDGDGDLDVVTGNAGINRVYLNNDTSNPFENVIGLNISEDDDRTESLALDDVDGDGDLDVVAGNSDVPNRLYLNNGTENPFENVTGLNITDDVDSTNSIALKDIDGDGDFDVVAGNANGNRIYRNNGSEEPFVNAIGATVAPFPDNTQAIAVADVNGDNLPEVITGNSDGPNYIYFLHSNLLEPAKGGLQTHLGNVVSLTLDDRPEPNQSATLTAVAEIPLHSSIEFYLTNNGGQKWYQVQSGEPFIFPTIGHDLRWRADLRSSSPAVTPVLTSVSVTTNPITPEASKAPSNLSATVLSAASISLEWEDNSDNEMLFRIDRKTADGSFSEIATVDANIISHTDEGLQAETEYLYRVRAENAAGNSNYSNTETQTTLSDSSPFPIMLQGNSLPEKVTVELSASKPSESVMTARLILEVFDADKANEGELNINGNGPIRLFGKLKSPKNNRTTARLELMTPADWWQNGDNTLEFIHTRSGGYRVESGVVEFPILSEAPEAPSNLSATVLSATSISLEWEDNSDNEMRFRIDRKTGDGSFSELVTVDANITSHADEGLLAETEYSYRVRAENAAGNSNYSNTETQTTQSDSSPFPIALQGNSLPEKVIVELSASKPSEPVVTARLILEVFDADKANEGELNINGNGPIRLFGKLKSPENNRTTARIELMTPPDWWQDGVNTLEFIHTRSGGYRVESAIVEFDESSAGFPLVLQGRELPEEATIVLKVSKPAEVSAAVLNLTVFDADKTNEGELIINGNSPIRLFGKLKRPENNRATVTLALSTPSEWWQDGDNTLRFIHTRSGGYRVENATVNFGATAKAVLAFVYSEEPGKGLSIAKINDAKSDETTSSTIYEDAEDKTTAGWYKYNQGTVKNVMGGAGGSDRAIEIIGDIENDVFRLGTEYGSDWNNDNEFYAEFSVLFAEASSGAIYFEIDTSDGIKYLAYTTGIDVEVQRSNTIYFDLGDIAAGEWHTIQRNLEKDLRRGFPDSQLNRVNSLFVYGSLKLDKIILSNFE